MMKNLLLIIFVFLFTTTGYAQDTGLQTVDHDSRHAHIASMHSYGGGVLYSSRNDGLPFSRLNYIDADQNKVVLFESPYEHSTVRYFDQPDGTVHMYMIGLFDYDLTIGSIYKFSFDGTTLIFEDLDQWDYFTEFTDVEEFPNTDHLLIIKDRELILLDTVSFTENPLGMSDLSYFSSLHSSDQGVVYLHSEDNVYKVAEDFSITQRLSLPGLERIFFMANDTFAVTTDDEIIFFAEDFQKEFIGSSIPTGYTFGNDMNYRNGTLYFQLVKDGIHSTWKMNVLGNMVKIREEESTEVFNSFIDFLGDDIVLGGQFEMVKPTGLIRSFRENDLLAYETKDISLDDFYLEHLGQDTLSISENAAGETIYYVNYRLSYEYAVTNRGDEEINVFDVYSTDLVPFFKSFFHDRREVTLAPGESQSFSGEFNLYWSQFPIVAEDYTFYIPGVDYLMDSNIDDNTLLVNVVSGTEEVVANNLVIYPNPTLSRLSVDSEMSLMHERYIITDLFGQTVRKGQMENNTLMVKDLVPGTYFLIFPYGEGRSALRFIKL